jgi:hypothetical protein
MRDTVSRARTSLRVLLESFPTLMAFLFDKEVGGAYGVGAREKLNLVRAFRRNAKAIEILSHGYEHLELAAAILRVPPSVEGDVVECGCYVGGSSVNLSLTCALVGRRLIICDSFEGLPEPAEHDREHPAPHVGHTDRYEEGMFAAGLDVVKDNLAKHGDLSVCEFIVGFFEDSLVGFNRPVVMGFLDVDLIDSLKPCLTGLWPNLADGCRLYVHEARSVSLVSIFFDAPWWRENLDADAPGFIGAGSGLPLTAPLGSEIGYAQRGIVASRVTAGT